MPDPMHLPTVTCAWIAEDFEPDGDLFKSVWGLAETLWLAPAYRPRAGCLPSDQRDLAVASRDLADEAAGNPGARRWTAAGLLYSPTALYVGFFCLDRDIWAGYTQHDDPLYDEEVCELFIAPGGDVRRYQEIEVNPLGVTFDADISSPDRVRSTMVVNREWECDGLAGGVRVEGHVASRPADTGDSGSDWWSVELRVPFASLPGGSTPKPGDEWRANLFRIDRARAVQYLSWSATLATPANFHVPDRFGRIRFGEVRP